ncbi:MAG: hypothetical protein HY248_06955, partial [Fimbriimonas ginsengisoli]|nr:hypothetical protein [Fimbriimonas ginsengisoli]
MTKSIFALFLVGILAGGQAAQEAQTKPGTGLIKKPPKAVKGLSGPVTSSEVIAVCHRVESALQRVLKLPPAPKTALKESTAPARRDPIVLEFERLYIYARPKFVVTFRPALIDR